MDGREDAFKQIFAYANLNDFESNMPGFAETLSEQDIRDVLAFI